MAISQIFHLPCSNLHVQNAITIVIISNFTIESFKKDGSLAMGRMAMIWNTALLALLMMGTNGIAQNYPKNYFRHPVDGELLLSGSFGELRSNHFHMGLDIKTFGEGKTVYACADAYVARVKVSHYGYGKVLYLAHPNGYTTVYAHLSRFTDKIEKFVKSYQYFMQDEEIDVTLPDTVLVFKKGDVIAYSGNTGSSNGAHLHFEIRDTKTEEGLNPLLFGIKVKDDKKPVIYGIKAYPLNDTSNINGRCEPQRIDLKKDKSGALIKTVTIKAWGDIGLGLQANDYTSNSSNRCGIYEACLTQGNEQVFAQRVERIDFATNRFINTYKDFDEFHEHKRHIHKSFIKGNNKLKVYPVAKNDGHITVRGKDTLVYKYRATDVPGNSDEIIVRIIPQAVHPVKKPGSSCSNFIKFDQPFDIHQENIKISLGPNTLYDDICADFKIIKGTAQTYSDVYCFSGDEKMLQEYFDVQIKVDVDTALASKLVVAHQASPGKFYSQKGLMVDGWVSTQVRRFGNFTVVADTIAPVISMISPFRDSMYLAPNKELTFKIEDDLSGFKRYYVFVDGNWVLTHRNVKTGKITLSRNEIKGTPGYHQLKIEALDERKNKRVFEAFIKL